MPSTLKPQPGWARAGAGWPGNPVCGHPAKFTVKSADTDIPGQVYSTDPGEGIDVCEKHLADAVIYANISTDPPLSGAAVVTLAEGGTCDWVTEV